MQFVRLKEHFNKVYRSRMYRLHRDIFTLTQGTTVSVQLPIGDSTHVTDVGDCILIGVSYGIEMNSATWVLILVWKAIEVVWLKRLEFLLSQVFHMMKGIKVAFGVSIEAFVVFMVVSLRHVSFIQWTKLRNLWFLKIEQSP
uniref:Uncharacterized protein LOC104243233 n=1 Tax=Nicotiana sylvestris TaxID=4096 RepID=A0A1U7Y0M9_NICSY|nr:PREDICTED: uncharacterized protein LOC104243233 [Nicotiana sylvestris]